MARRRRGRARHGGLDEGRDGPLTVTRFVRAARRDREECEPSWKAYKRELVGAHHRQGKGERRLIPYQYMFESTFLPELAARLPELTYKAVLEQTDGALAELVALAANHCLRLQGFLEELREVVRDAFYAFMFGQTFTEGQERTSLYGDHGPYFTNVPGFERLSPFYCLRDPRAQSFRHQTAVGHEYAQATEIVEVNPRFDRSLVDELKDHPRSGEEVKGHLDEKRFRTGDEEQLGDYHKLVQLYVRPTNTLYTLWEHCQDQFKILRKESWWGPQGGPGGIGRIGPYHYGAFLPVNDDVHPLAPGIAWRDRYIELEKVSQHNNENAQAEKNGVTAEEGDEKKLQAWQKAPNQRAITGLKNVRDTHTGGVTEQGLTYEANCWQVLEMASTLRAVGRQNIGQGTTATTASIIAGGTQSQTGDKRGCIAIFAAGIGDVVGFYAYEDETFRQNVTVHTPEGAPVDVEIMGGPPQDEFGLQMPQPPWHERLWCEVDPDTLYRDHDEVRRARVQQDGAFIAQVLRPWLNSQGMDLDAYRFMGWYCRGAGLSALTPMVIPLSPMAAAMIQMGTQETQGRERSVVSLARVGEAGSQMSGVMNSQPTNGLISDRTRGASFMRESSTPYGANNPVGAGA